jgi:hypothetical protein
MSPPSSESNNKPALLAASFHTGFLPNLFDTEDGGHTFSNILIKADTHVEYFPLSFLSFGSRVSFRSVVF